jgi:5-methylcytosine-specific restriction endonuclease McrA
MELKARFTFVEVLRTVRTTKPRIRFEASEVRCELLRRVLKDERDFVTAPAFTETRIWKRLRYDVLEAKDNLCTSCGGDGRGLGGLNVDHKRSRRDFPQLALLFGNLQILCGACNQGKGNRYNTDWEERRTAKAARDMPSAEACAELSTRAPGWDHKKLLDAYRRFRWRKRDETVHDPDKAFLAWVAKVTKGLPPEAAGAPRRASEAARAGKPATWKRSGRRPAGSRRPTR